MVVGLSKRCWALVDLAALERNVNKIRASLPKGVKYISVIKADAYGHGLTQVAPRLMRGFVDYFAVANIQEAIYIREIGSGWPILVLSPLLPEEDYLLLEYGLTAVISTYEEALRFEKIGQTVNKYFSVHLKVDTGMGRLGAWYTQATALYHKIKQLNWIKLEGILTHLSSADKDVTFTNEQRTRFKNIITECNVEKTDNLLVHVDNSAGLETFSPSYGANAIRVGLIQFGILPSKSNTFLSSLHTEPVLSLKARVGLVKTLPPNSGVSYGHTFYTKRKTHIGVVTAGYGDGIPISLSNKGKVIINGKCFPIVGRVTMDQTIVDITENPEIKVGDEVTLIGTQGKENISISQWSQWADTIEWDVYCSITKRVPRKYLNNSFS